MHVELFTEIKFTMEMWVSTKEMTNLTAPKGQVLVQYLSPFFGKLTTEITTGYFDNPNDYVDGKGKGGLTWVSDFPILVTHFQKLPDKAETPLYGINQKDFLDLYGSFFPNLGSVGN